MLIPRALVTRKVRWALKDKGYNILKSPLPLDNEDPTWYAEKVDDIWKYLDDLAGAPFQEPNVLVIDDALQIIRDEDLRGSVWV
ncbi:hypothetical protein [Sphingobacterium allocomposti]|uniref:hypothetical protein n=1 Tax=Sphingobacterium allocomposti TaxID=415956 RepID=UPI0011E736E2|nr:hypothetical protein [Sphingobacterium composti Yoo et al. 2007 non Ten et al. 2007]